METPNFCFVSLSRYFTEKVCEKLSKSLELFYANADVLIDFELMDTKKFEDLCGKDTLESIEKKILGRACKYENTLISLDSKRLVNEENLSIIKKNCIVFYLELSLDRYKLALSEELGLSEDLITIPQDLFDNRNARAKEVSDIVIDCKDIEIDALVKKITDNLKDME